MCFDHIGHSFAVGNDRESGPISHGVTDLIQNRGPLGGSGATFTEELSKGEAGARAWLVSRSE